MAKTVKEKEVSKPKVVVETKPQEEVVHPNDVKAQELGEWFAKQQSK